MTRPFWANWHIRTSLARHTLVVYVLSVLVACLVGAGVTYRSLRYNLESETRERLLEDARLYGLGVFARLTHADQMLARLTSVQDATLAPELTDPGSPFQSARLVRLDDAAGMGAADDDRARSRDLATVAERRLRASPLLESTIVLPSDGTKTLAVLVRPVPGSDRVFALGWIRPDYLSGGPELSSRGVQLCVGGSQGSFRVCRLRTDQTESTYAQAPSRSGSLVARWPLFLRARFGIEDWSIEASQPWRSVLAPLSGLGGAMPSIGVAVMLAVLLGGAFIRRNFVPLERMLAGWNASNGKATAAGVGPQGEFEQLSSFIALNGSQLEQSRSVFEALTELDRKILLAGSFQTVVLWLLPRIVADLEPGGVAVVFTATHDETTGTVYVAQKGSPPWSCACDVPIQNVRSVLEFDGFFALRNLAGEPFVSLAQRGFNAGRAYPVRDERHLVGALLLLDLPATDANTDRQGLAFADRLSVAVSHWRSKEALARATHFDSLTGLANRELLIERLGHALAKSAEARSLAVMLIGFDGLEKINSTLGHRAGDELLRLAAHRIRSVVRETEALARLTDDEIVLLVPDLDEPVDAAMVAERVIALFDKPFLADGLSYAVSVAIGIAVAPPDGLTPEGLIRSAETAMRRAKGGSAGQIAFFEEGMNEHAKRKVWLEHGLRAAMGTRELQVYFQPKVELATGRVVGAEALLRWIHPEQGAIQPAEFIPAAEASGLIVPIGEWVLEESCRRLLEWRRAGVHLDHIAVNLSLRQLQDDALLEHLLQHLAATGIDGRSLELEVTESMFAAEPARLSGALEQVRRRGVRIAIDDFGIGYSSLGLLQMLPVDVLKIDRAFVSAIETATGDAIVKAIIALSEALNKELVAEGVETEAQARALIQRGCRSAQGFFFAPALPASEFIHFYHYRQGLVGRGARARRA